jgi:hypothetical protein
MRPRVLGIGYHLRDAVLGKGVLEHGDQLLGGQRVQLDPAGAQGGDLRLGGAAFA